MDEMTEWNIKPRLVECPQCKLERITSEAGPKCINCKLSMVTIINSSK